MLSAVLITATGVLFNSGLVAYPSTHTPSARPERLLSQYVQRVWQTEDGLPENSVAAMVQTSDGYIWLGTEAGLTRFDGFRFVVFDKSNTHSLGSNTISALLVDRHQTLWIGTHGGGLTCYRNGRFEHYRGKDGLASETILALHEDKAGAIWVGTEASGIFRLSGAEVSRYGVEDGLPSNTVPAITSDAGGHVWLGTLRGLAQLSLDGEKVRTISRLPGAWDVRSIRVDHQDNVWVGTRGGLFSRPARAEDAAFTPIGDLAGETISAILEDRSHLLWVGTADSGVRLVSEGRLVDSEQIGGIWSLMQDNTGVVWAGETENGLASFRKGDFTTFTSTQGLASDVSLGIYQDRSGAMWFGSNAGLTRWRDGLARRFSKKDGLPDNLVFSVTEDGDGVIWIGTRRGLARLEGDRIHPYAEGDNGLPPGYPVWATFTDLDGSLWVGSRGTIAHRQGSGWTTFGVKQGVPDRIVTGIARDKQANLWVATDGGGLLLMDPTGLHARRLSTEDGLQSNVIYSLLPDDDGSLWLATNAGLSRYTGKRFQNVPKSAGVIDDALFSVIDDRTGYLWVSSNRGIQRLRKKDLLHYVDSGEHSPVEGRIFDVSDGLKSRECNGDFQSAGLRDRDGNLWFPTLKGVVSTDPRRDFTTGSLFPPMLESLVVGGKPQALSKNVQLPRGAKQIEFAFTDPGAEIPERVQFSYRLEGFDRDWISAGPRRVAYYTNLPAGDFKFRIRACLYGVCQESQSNGQFSVKPALYETIWFGATIALFLVGIGFGSRQLRIRQLRQSEKKLLLLVNERTVELRKSKDELELRVQERTHELSCANRVMETEIGVRKIAEERAHAASRAKSEFLTNMSHELRTPINGIMGMAEIALSTELDEEQQEYLEIIKESANSLLNIVSDILDFSKIEARKLELDSLPFRFSELVNQLRRLVSTRAAQKGLYFRVTIAPEVPDEVAGDAARLRQTLLNLIDNAVKFTITGGVAVEITPVLVAESSCTVRFAVIDTGIGIPEHKKDSIFDAFCQADNSSTRRFGGTGLGLTICSELVQLMRGRIQVESTEGLGSTFSFTAEFPLVSPDSLDLVA